MNTGVASYAPKNVTYSTTDSLETRVTVAAGIHIVRYANFWKSVFDILTIPMKS